MNPPPSLARRIWDKFNTEPRHFFFWLAMFGLTACLAALAITLAAEEALPTVPSLFLAGILAFLIGTPAFLLAWIPPLRRLFARLLPYKLILAVGLGTLICLVFAIENWRGRTAWQNYRTDCEARGVYFTADKIMPPKIPAADNMYAASPWSELTTQTNSDGVLVSTAWFDLANGNPGRMPKIADLALGRRENMIGWQEYYRGSNNLSAATPGQTPTNFLPVTATPQTPASDVLYALSIYDDELANLRAAAQRPGAWFDVDFESGFKMVLPHLAKFKSCVQYLRLRSVALLHDGQKDAAAAELKLALRLNQALAEEPILISHLVQVAVSQITLTAVYEGWAGQLWDAPQLAALETELAKVDLLRGYHSGMSGERFFSIWCVDYLQRTADLHGLYGPMGNETTTPGFGEQVGIALGRIGLRLIPRGWFEQNKLALARLHVERLMPLVDEERQVVPPGLSKARSENDQAFRPTPYNLFGGMLLPALDRVAPKTALAQTYLNLTRVAIALERHRLAHGQYPEALSALTPQFLATIPHDLINGEPLKYRRTDDGKFILYSVGWNETDDGGTVALNKAGNFDSSKGDWVWRYPAE